MENLPKIDGKQSIIDGNSYRNRWRIQSKMNGNIHTKAMENAPNVDGKIHTQWNGKSINSINTSKEHQWKNPPKITRKSTPNSKKQPKISGRPHPKLLGAQKKSDRKTSWIDGKPNRQPMQKINQNRWAIDPNIDGRDNPTCWGNPPKQLMGKYIQNRWDVCVCM